MLLLGTVSLLVGAGVTLLAISSSSELVFLAGTSVAGIGFGSGFQGAIRTVVPLAADDERAGVLSVIFLVSYLSMGLPAVIAGYLVVHGGGLMTTAREYTVAVMALAALALVGLARRRGSAPARPEAPVRCTSVLAPRTAAGGRAAR
jgi:predicted MFS family arabinose efflux permease